jgi:hypothetical protein
MGNNPTNPGWIGTGNSNSNFTFPFIGQGAYVDLGYGYDQRRMPNPQLPSPRFANQFSSATLPWFFTARPLSDVRGLGLAPGYSVFDTWSFHYENNGLNEDQDEIEGTTWQLENYNGTGTPQIDEGTNGLDDPGHYVNNATDPPTYVTELRLGPDDVGERETTPPYDKPLRGIQALLRLYERDSRQVRQVSVNQTLVPE